jgi:hypothetical protein
MKRFSILLVAVLLAVGCGSSNAPSSSPSSTNLPSHTVASDTSLAPKDGRRIEIHVSNPALTKDECTALINAYRSKAGPEGQVSVRKPDKTGELQPWCIDNMDGKPIIFNDFFFQ